MGTTSVRRNLFHHHLSKRSVPAAPPHAPLQVGPPGGLSSLSSHVMSSESTQPLGPATVDGGEIVVKDKNGRYKLDIPILSGEDGNDTEGLEESGATRGSGPPGADSSQTEISGREKEKIEASLVEMMYRNRNRQMSSEPAEILNLIHQSLRNKVASLDEDNWIYEPESDSQF
ncbi:hypothetical protein BDV28DRAFT_24835 [Aspergillus coremiiformis]|uniref:Uncharacterized protein n=1 Tax=Aspergillus coremiiformis TaxID=138285 RepID=A0A5N6Z0J2_9EURO|nr:hypothetical protein BDV28DRAFT_24835 [Aspergillus coremiiformis]